MLPSPIRSSAQPYHMPTESPRWISKVRQGYEQATKLAPEVVEFVLSVIGLVLPIIPFPLWPRLVIQTLKTAPKRRRRSSINAAVVSMTAVYILAWQLLSAAAMKAKSTIPLLSLEGLKGIPALVILLLVLTGTFHILAVGVKEAVNTLIAERAAVREQLCFTMIPILCLLIWIIGVLSFSLFWINELHPQLALLVCSMLSVSTSVALAEAHATPVRSWWWIFLTCALGWILVWFVGGILVIGNLSVTIDLVAHGSPRTST